MMKRALLWEKDFNLGLWFITKEVKVIEETPTAVKIKRLIGTKWIPKKAMGIIVEMIDEKKGTA